MSKQELVAAVDKAEARGLAAPNSHPGKAKMLAELVVVRRLLAEATDEQIQTWYDRGSVRVDKTAGALLALITDARALMG